MKPKKGGDKMLERMDSFFEKRVVGYDEHMINEVEGCKEGYAKIAELVPEGIQSLLDLGCGTGLELEGIFKKNPSVQVTGIDLTKAMLDQLQQKYKDKCLTLVNGDYFKQDLGEACYDAAVSCQTMHHFSHEEKIALYTKIHHALKAGGCYVECDYMVLCQEEETRYFDEYARMKKELATPDHVFYHFDMPCTIENQRQRLLKAGFKVVERKWREGNTTIIMAQK